MNNTHEPGFRKGIIIERNARTKRLK